MQRALPRNEMTQAEMLLTAIQQLHVHNLKGMDKNDNNEVRRIQEPIQMTPQEVMKQMRQI